MSQPTDKMTEWLSANLETYERYLLHAAFHDPHYRDTLIGHALLSPEDFGPLENSLVASALITAEEVAKGISCEIAYPPAPSLMQSYINLAAKQQICGDEDIQAAMDLVEDLQDPSLKELHYMVNSHFEIWFTMVRGGKMTRRMMMKRVNDYIGLIDQIRSVAGKAVEIMNPDVSREFDLGNPPEPPEAVLKLGEHTVCTPGNISNIQGPPKAAKSAVVGAILAATLHEPGQEIDALGFTAGNPDGQAVVHFDTEQSMHDHHSLVRRAYIRAGRNSEAKWLTSYCLTGMEPPACWDYLRRKVGMAAVEHNGVRMIIIDGIADFCSDPNDAKECFALVQKLHKLALAHQCVILTVLHENPGSAAGKTRGHLGSQLDRKAETSLRLVKDEKTGAVVMWADRARHCFMSRSQGWQFRWCDDAKMHITLNRDDVDFVRDKPDKLTKYTGEVVKAFGQHDVLTYTELVKALIRSANVAESTAKARVPVYEQMNLVEKSDDGKYRMFRALRVA